MDRWDEERVREIVREELAKSSVQRQELSVELSGDQFSREQVLGLIEQINEAVADGAMLNIVNDRGMTPGRDVEGQK